MIFKNALGHLPYRQALLTRDDQTFYELVLEQSAVTTLRRAEEEPSGPIEPQPQRLRIYQSAHLPYHAEVIDLDRVMIGLFMLLKYDGRRPVARRGAKK